MSSLRKNLRGYAFIAPNFIGFMAFTALPVLGAMVMSLHGGTFGTRFDESGALRIEAEWVGLANFSKILGFDAVSARAIPAEGGGEEWVIVDEPRGDAAPAARIVTPHLLLFCGEARVREIPAGVLARAEPGERSLLKARDPKFWFTLYNTLIFMLGIPLGMGCSLGLALLLNRKIGGRVIYRTLLFLPSVASGVAMFLCWRWIFNPNVGLLNDLLGDLYLIGEQGPDWLGDPYLVRPAIIAMGIWTAMGGTNMILFLAGLQGVDPTLYEAAEIDGAGVWAKFIHVTWPQLRPTTFFILTTNLIAGFQMFDQAYVMTSGGPEGATTTLVYYIYQQMFRFQEMGYAAALAMVLFVIVLLVTLANWLLSSRSRKG